VVVDEDLHYHSSMDTANINSIVSKRLDDVVMMLLDNQKATMADC
jgi:hypothetical protein